MVQGVSLARAFSLCSSLHCPWVIMAHAAAAAARAPSRTDAAQSADWWHARPAGPH